MKVKKDSTAFTVAVTRQVSRDEVGNLLCSAFEGGSNYWYRIEKFHKPTRFEFNSGKDLGKEAGYFKQIDYPLNPGGYLIVSDYNALCEGDFPTEKKLDLASIQRGLELFANSKDYAHHWQDFVTENDDQTTADVFLQFCLFGEVVYG